MDGNPLPPQGRGVPATDRKRTGTEAEASVFFYFLFVGWLLLMVWRVSRALVPDLLLLLFSLLCFHVINAFIDSAFLIVVGCCK